MISIYYRKKTGLFRDRDESYAEYSDEEFKQTNIALYQTASLLLLCNTFISETIVTKDLVINIIHSVD